MDTQYSGARFLATAALLAAAALLAFVVAYWGTQALAPAPVHIAPAAPSDPVATILASGLMRAPGAPPSAAPAKEETTLSGDTRLLGVFAERDGRVGGGPWRRHVPCQHGEGEDAGEPHAGYIVAVAGHQDRSHRGQEVTDGQPDHCN